MKCSNFIEIFKNGNMVIPLYLLKNLKKLKLELNEFIFLMYIYNIGNRSIFNPNKFCEDLNYELMEMMTLVSELTDKGFIKVEVVKNEKGIMEEVIILDGFYDKLNILILGEVNNQESVDVENSTIFELIETEFGRTLGPMEYEIIKAWLEQGFTEDLIKEVLKEAVFSGVSNLRYMDTILYEWSKNGIKTAEDVEKNRKKKNAQKEKENDIDLEIVEWSWFDDED